MDKKAAIPSALIDFIAYATYILVIVAFFFLFTIKANARTTDIIDNDFAEVNGEQFLISYLSTPIEFEGQNITTAEFIAVLYERQKISAVHDKIRADITAYVKAGGCIHTLYLLDKDRSLFGTVPMAQSVCDPGANGMFTSTPVTILTHTNENLCLALVRPSKGLAQRGCPQ